jgi:hypothetical protein
MRVNDGLMKKPGALYLLFFFAHPFAVAKALRRGGPYPFAVVQLNLVTALLPRPCYLTRPCIQSGRG